MCQADAWHELWNLETLFHQTLPVTTSVCRNWTSVADLRCRFCCGGEGRHVIGQMNCTARERVRVLWWWPDTCGALTRSEAVTPCSGQTLRPVIYRLHCKSAIPRPASRSLPLNTNGSPESFTIVFCVVQIPVSPCHQLARSLTERLGKCT
jgi:hypothetical protein